MCVDKIFTLNVDKIDNFRTRYVCPLVHVVCEWSLNYVSQLQKCLPSNHLIELILWRLPKATIFHSFYILLLRSLFILMNFYFTCNKRLPHPRLGSNFTRKSKTLSIMNGITEFILAKDIKYRSWQSFIQTNDPLFELLSLV